MQHLLAKAIGRGVSHTLVHSDRHWYLPYFSRDIILHDSAIGDPVFFQDLSLLSWRERLCAPNRRSVVKMSACRTPLDSRLTNATCDNSSDPILNPHDAWYRKSKPVTPSSMGFFRDCRGRDMEAGLQAAGISDDRETERAYLNMEAR
jgi:hypothetical protein